MQSDKPVTVITGGSKGIGRACALALARRGDTVVIAARGRDDLDATAELICSEGGSVQAMQVDISIAAQVQALFEKIDQLFGGLRWLVNCAAVLGPLRPLTEVSIEAWSQTLAINLTGTYLCCGYAARAMARLGGGAIVNFTSGLARSVLTPFGAYSVSKAGVDILTRYLAAEMASLGIRVNAVSPGLIDTPMQAHIRSKDPALIGEEVHQRFVRFKEEGQLKSPDDVAQLVAFLTSPASSHINGKIGGPSDYAALGWLRAAEGNS